MLGQVFVLILAFYPLVFCSPVLVLNGDNFDAELRSRPLALVKFYAPWCGHCKMLAPVFIEAAEKLVKSGSSALLAEVDCTADTGKELCSKYGVSGYPSLKVFRNGNFDTDYEGARSADKIVQFMEDRARPPSTLLKNVDEIDAFLSLNKPSVIVFVKSESDPFLDVCKQVAVDYLDNVVFAHLIDGSGNRLEMHLPKRLHTKLEPSKVAYAGDLKADQIKDWIRHSGHGLVGHRTPDNQLFFPDTNLVVIYHNMTFEAYPSGVRHLRNRLIKALTNLGESVKGLKVAYSYVGDFRGELAEFGFESDVELPVVRIRCPAGKKYQDKLSLENFAEFLQKFIDGKLTPYLKSEPIPTEDSGAVKKVVTLNFESVVNDPTKDVFIVFHAPWCGHCKNLMPKYEEAAKMLVDEPNIVFAAMDATSNDVPKPFEVTGFPTLYFVPKDSKDKPRSYHGNREAEDLIKYVARESTEELKGYDRSGRKKKEEL